MFRLYTIPSGNGVVGYTTLTVNRGISRALPDRETCIHDADTGMADTTLSTGMDDGPVTLHEVLAGKADIGDAVYEGPGADVSRAFRTIAARIPGIDYREEAGGPRQAL